jgi:hypothetical protein
MKNQQGLLIFIPFLNAIKNIKAACNTEKKHDLYSVCELDNTGNHYFTFARMFFASRQIYNSNTNNYLGS